MQHVLPLLFGNLSISDAPNYVEYYIITPILFCLLVVVLTFKFWSTQKQYLVTLCVGCALFTIEALNEKYDLDELRNKVLSDQNDEKILTDLWRGNFVEFSNKLNETGVTSEQVTELQNIINGYLLKDDITRCFYRILYDDDVEHNVIKHVCNLLSIPSQKYLSSNWFKQISEDSSDEKLRSVFMAYLDFQDRRGVVSSDIDLQQSIWDADKARELFDNESAQEHYREYGYVVPSFNQTDYTSDLEKSTFMFGLFILILIIFKFSLPFVSRKIKSIDVDNLRNKI